MMQTKRYPPSVRPKQGAELLGVSLPTFWRWAAKTPGFPKGRRLSARCTIFDVAELIAWRDSKVKGGK